MTTEKTEFGAKGETAACLFLTKKGYKIVERNVRYPWGELDVVTKAPDGTLVFVEVKTVHEGVFTPEDQMTGAKMEKFRRTASLYAGFRHDLVSDDRGYRLDLVALIRNSRGFAVAHYENV